MTDPGRTTQSRSPAFGGPIAEGPAAEANPEITFDPATLIGGDAAGADAGRVDGAKPGDATTVSAYPPEVFDSPRQTTEKYVGRFRIVREIARGRFGIVYEAADEQLDRRVAIKRARSEVLDDVDQVRRFAHEAELASSLDHPGIVPIYEVGADDGELYIVMGLCSDQTLSDWIKSSNEPMTPGRAVRLILQIAAAVAHGHERGVIHRDIKPDNVGVTDPAGSEANVGLPTLRLLDFGLSYNLDQTVRHTRSSVTMGTPLYMAPEQLRTSDVGPEADVYSLGSILYELLTGRTPFRGATSAEVVDKLWRERPTPPASFNSLVSPELEAICMRCLEKRPSDRYETADAFSDDLNRWLAGRPTQARPDSFLRRVGRWASKQDRIRESGAVLMMQHLFLPVWGITGHVGARVLSDGLDAMQMIEMGTFLALFTIPVHSAFAWSGYQMWKGTPRAPVMWVTLVACAGMLAFHFGRAVDIFEPPTQWYADHPAAKWLVFWMLALTAMVDVAAMLLAIFADRRSRSAEAERSGMTDVMDIPGRGAGSR